jgi:hypothetical protein
MAKDVAPKWEFQSTKDKLTDENYTNIDLTGEAGSAALSIRCERMVEIKRIIVPIYTLQIATSDYLGETEHSWPPPTRLVAYRLGADQVVYEEWIYSERNAEQVFPLLLPSESQAAEILNRVRLVERIVDGGTFKIRVRTYRHKDLDFTFVGRDPTGANEKLIAECRKRTSDKNK